MSLLTKTVNKYNLTEHKMNGNKKTFKILIYLLVAQISHMTLLVYNMFIRRRFNDFLKTKLAFSITQQNMFVY